jgi:cobalamin biosynthesis Mg chelatase CobN
MTGAIPSSADSRPVPDPTALTTQQLNREISALREFVLGEIRHVREVSQVKFEAVAVRTAEQKADTKEAVDAALRAAREAVVLQTAAADKAIAKSEAAIAKQIDALVVQMDKSGDASDERIGDLKDRVRALETAKLTKDEGSTKTGAIITLVISAILVIVAVVVAANALTG